MIGYLSGRILEHTDGKLLVGLGTGDGVTGYQVSVPKSAEYGSLMKGEKIELWIHTHVKEDALDLFGFSSTMEKDLFLTLLNVNGIGPKGALAILSGSSTESLIQAIMDGNKAYLHQLPGVGKKTADRVVLELAEPLRKKFPMGSAPGAGKRGDGPAPSAAKKSKPDVFADARSALLGLGYSEQDVGIRLNQALASSETEPTHAEELVRAALKGLS